MREIYETNRLVLRVLDGSHASLALNYHIRNYDFFKQWEPGKPREFYTTWFHEDKLELEREAIGQGELVKLWIFKRGEPGRTIGFFSFSNIIRNASMSCLLGYKLDCYETNKGYMTEALQTGLDIAFGELGMHRIEAYIMPANARSLRVVEKLGFTREGVAKKYLNINGKWEDHIRMVLISESL